MTQLEQIERQLLEAEPDASDLAPLKGLLEERGHWIGKLAFQAMDNPNLELLAELRRSLSAGEKITEKLAVFRQTLTGPLHWLSRYAGIPALPRTFT